MTPNDICKGCDNTLVPMTSKFDGLNPNEMVTELIPSALFYPTVITP